MITAKELRALVHYDPETGAFTNLVSRSNKARVGGRADRPAANGYRFVRRGIKRYRAHRLAWLYMTGEWPPDEIDHINGVRDDNRWVNLRIATRGQNLCNARRRSDNTSGYKGVCWDANKGKWLASITINRKNKFLGHYETPEAGHEAYFVAAREHFGEFARRD